MGQNKKVPAKHKSCLPSFPPRREGEAERANISKSHRTPGGKNRGGSKTNGKTLKKT